MYNEIQGWLVRVTAFNQSWKPWNSKRNLGWEAQVGTYNQGEGPSRAHDCTTSPINRLQHTALVLIKGGVSPMTRGLQLRPSGRCLPSQERGPVSSGSRDQALRHAAHGSREYVLYPQSFESFCNTVFWQPKLPLPLVYAMCAHCLKCSFTHLHTICEKE